MSQSLTHLDAQGRAHMVDVGEKPMMKRTAEAEGYFVARGETLDLIMSSQLPKGDAITTARLAGIQAAKRCDELIPLCHTLPLDVINVEIERSAVDRLRITSQARLVARTGVEMEALTAVSISALTLWDMVKGVDRNLRIEGIRLLSKSKQPLENPA